MNLLAVRESTRKWCTKNYKQVNILDYVRLGVTMISMQCNVELWFTKNVSIEIHVWYNSLISNRYSIAWSWIRSTILIQYLISWHTTSYLIAKRKLVRTNVAAERKIHIIEIRDNDNNGCLKLQVHDSLVSVSSQPTTLLICDIHINMGLDHH